MTHFQHQIRQKTFDIPHKGLRALLAELCLWAGKSDFSDSTHIDRLEQLGNDLFELLAEHAAGEDDLLLAPLEQRCPGAALQNTAEHVEIEKQQARLEAMFHALIREAREGAEVGPLAEQFYFDLNRFQSAYLLHMLEEEEETQRLLWKHFSDAELLDMRRQIIGRMQPATQIKWYRYAAPAMSHLGRLQWLSAMKSGTPAQSFARIMEVLEEALTEQDYLKLKLTLDGQ